MLYNDSLPEDLAAACSAALMADIACDPLVPALRHDFFYPPATLTRMCTTGCASALQSWESTVRSACGKDVVIPGEDDLDTSPIMIPASRRYIYSFTCLKENNVFCGPVAALAAFSANPGVSPFNYIIELPDGAVKPTQCDPCLAARLRLRSGSPYFDDPVVASESIYQTLTSSCGITGKPATTTTIDYLTTQPEPTDSVCDGTMYQIQGGDDCYGISEAQSVGTAWLLSDNHLGAYCNEFPTSGSLCITNTCKTVTVAVNTTCNAIATTTAGITEPQLLAWNPVINPVCSNLDMMNGTTLCIEPPGPKLPPAQTTNVPPVTPTSAASIPANTAIGSDKPCGRWYEVEAGDYCNTVTLKFAISLEDFAFLNTGINTNCTNLYAKESYCIQAVGDINDYPGRPGYNSFTIDPEVAFTGVPFTMLPNATITLDPRPTKLPLATGVRDDCTFYFTGDEFQYSPDVFGYWTSNCEIAASTYNVDYDSFAAWNSLSTNVTDPTCVFHLGLRYCGSWGLTPTQTSTEEPAPTGTQTGPQPPANTHDGQPEDCDGWHVVVESDSCQSVADKAAISLVTFLEWNPAVSDDCKENFWLDQAYCTHREGQGISTTASSSSTIATTTAKPTAPAPTHTGQPADCNKWDVVADGDSCGSLASDNGITIDQFYAWNPAVSKDCITNFWLKQAYCVGRSSVAGATTTTSSKPVTSSSPTTTKPTAPGPTHTGQPADCNKWDIVTDGDSCGSLASDNGITIDQFYAWNPAVSKDCITNFWLKQAYCVGRTSVAGATTASAKPSTSSKPVTSSNPTTTKPTAPAPTHAGQPANCNKWDVVGDGDGCWSMANDNGITLDQFYKWNPAITNDCGTNFWLGQAYCVGISS
ncbi:carbohydrate-binding module family 50 protein [Didymella exigua CBS 183.55]|uniref:Carbohydrate-binding module family 50 protein n=1 Tax=Didymella exigua CBS 183.55 TaxID=1150837 RepID=A0A6A5RQR0_9PLEO|nr:carbohydrate-binding module family 50 protein [Didymella exigua CBS 183.55]KAF1927817.1 carbohydrate-binding module family 50 protein [Didymella exigua CBS 183.55]